MYSDFDVLGIGNPLVDFVAFCDEEISALLGLHPNANVDVTRERLTEILIALPEPIVSSGGGAANVAKLTARMGHKSAFIGTIGSSPDGEKDRLARHFERALHRAGVELYLKPSPRPTGASALIHMPGGLYSIAADPSAGLDLAAKDIDSSLIRRARLLMLDGFLLSRTELIAQILSLAEQYGTTVALDVALPRIASTHAPYIAEIAGRYPLILFMNEIEALAFCVALRQKGKINERHSELASEDDDRFKEIQDISQEGPFPIVVIKRGERGVLVYASGMRYVVSTRAQTPFERSGAGDAFSAGFLSAWLNGRSLRGSAQHGNRLAREILSVCGTDSDKDRPSALRAKSPVFRR